LAIGQKIGDRALVALALQGIGLVYVLQSDNPKALEYYNQALVIVRDLNNAYGEAILLSSVAGVYSNLGEKQKAIQYYNQALTLW